jgi:ABC-type lipopolysaccharide export system ATPase subunit
LVKVRAMGVVLLVEQNAKHSLAIAGRGYLMETGRVLGEGTAAQFKLDAAVQRAYLASNCSVESERAGSRSVACAARVILRPKSGTLC